jgi:ABC-type sugar transport system permease subunit
VKRDTLWGYLFVVPNLLLVLTFLIYPLLQAFRLSLFDAGLYSQTFVGLENYREIFRDDVFLISLKNTFYFVILIVPAVIVTALTFAALMQGFKQRTKAVYRLIFYLPVVMTPVVLSMIWRYMFNPSYGLVTYFAELLGFGMVDFFSSQTSALLALSFVVVIWMLGQPIILFLSAIDGVPPELYEAAKIDGANSLQAFFRITRPMIMHATLLITVTSTISVFQIFVVIHLISGGGPYHGTESLVYTIYNTAFVSLEFGKASAQSVVLFGIVAVVAAIQFRLMKPSMN